MERLAKLLLDLWPESQIELRVIHQDAYTTHHDDCIDPPSIHLVETTGQVIGMTSEGLILLRTEKGEIPLRHDAESGYFSQTQRRLHSFSLSVQTDP
jgi:hypothetical protein